MEILLFVDICDEIPADKQAVWLCMLGADHPVPAIFHKHPRIDYFSLLDGQETSGSTFYTHKWSPMTYPSGKIIISESAEPAIGAPSPKASLHIVTEGNVGIGV